MGSSGRGGGIRTHGLFVPNEARYQTALRPDIIGGARAYARTGGGIPNFQPPCKWIFQPSLWNSGFLGFGHFCNHSKRKPKEKVSSGCRRR